jgi:FtsZ-binding cell division protein ZapB
MKPAYEEQGDALGKLEQRIQQAVDAMSRLRQEKEVALLEKESAVAELEAARGEVARLTEELETLRADRKQVRTRIEKLLSQIDLLSAG